MEMWFKIRQILVFHMKCQQSEIYNMYSSIQLDICWIFKFGREREKKKKKEEKGAEGEEEGEEYIEIRDQETEKVWPSLRCFCSLWIISVLLMSRRQEEMLLPGIPRSPVWKWAFPLPWDRVLADTFNPFNLTVTDWSLPVRVIQLKNGQQKSHKLRKSWNIPL